MSAPAPSFFERSSSYLPVTHDSARAFIEQRIVPAQPVERAGLFAMLQVLRAGAGESSVDLSNLLFRAERLFTDLPGPESEEHLLALLDAAELPGGRDVAATLSECDVFFASAAQMRSRSWADPFGRYSGDFQERCRDTFSEFHVALASGLAEQDEGSIRDADGDESDQAPSGTKRSALKGTRDQAVAVAVLVAAPDERVSLSAFGGCGKTYILSLLADAAVTGFTYVAPSKQQLLAFVERVGSAAIASITLGELAKNLERAYRKSTKARSAGRTYFTDDQQQEVLGIPRIGRDSPQVVLRNIKGAIWRWCHSSDATLDSGHFNVRQAYSLSRDDVAIYVSMARRVWELMMDQSDHRPVRLFTIRTPHLLKWLCLQGARIPARYGTLLLDESHDLPAPLFEMLRDYPGGWVAMGDPHQKLAGDAAAIPQTKALSMSQSVRMGTHTAPLVESVLERMPDRFIGETFRGSRDHSTRCRFFEGQGDRATPGLHLYGDEWALLTDALYIKHGGARFRLLDETARNLQNLVTDALSLYHGQDVARTYSLQGIGSAEELSEHLESIGHNRVANLLQRGFRGEDLRRLFAAQTPDGEQEITLGLVEHGKNLEFSRVTLAPCCFRASRTRKSYSVVRAAYLAITRVRDELWLPGDAIDRLPKPRSRADAL